MTTTKDPNINLLCNSLTVNDNCKGDTSLIARGNVLTTSVQLDGEVVLNSHMLCGPLDAGVGFAARSGCLTDHMDSVVNISWDGSKMNFWVDDWLVAYYDTLA